MMQRVHFHRITFAIAFFALFLSAVPARAQLSESVVNSEYRDIILQQLHKSVEKREAAMRKKAEKYLLALPNGQKLYDETKMKIKADLVSGVNADGQVELNYRTTIEYNCDHRESLFDNYPAGAYKCESSNAAVALCELVRMMVDDVSKDAFKTGKLVTITLHASTDITEVSHIKYGGEYGEFQYISVRYNDEPVRLSVSEASGINSNAQLAFIRAQGLKDNLLRNVKQLKGTENEWIYNLSSNYQTGSQYRNVAVEIVVHGAFNEEIVAMNDQLINDEFIDYNIPKVEEGSNSKTYVLVLANERYAAPLPEVPYAYNDGEMFVQYCVRALGVPSRHVKIIEDATVSDIKIDGVNWLKDIAVSQKGDCNLIIYYVGHGLGDYDHNPYLVPAGIDYKTIKSLYGKDTIDVTTVMSKRDTKRLLSQCLRVDTLCSWFNRMKFNSLTVILDASFDGYQRDGNQLVNMKQSTNKAKGLRIRSDAVVISAAQYDKTAFVFDEQHHGFLTYYILKEIKKRKGTITYSDLFGSVDTEVQRETALQGRLQEPCISIGGKLKDRWGDLILR